MTWIDDVDEAEPISGELRHTRALNAFTIAQAEKQWIKRPGAKAVIGRVA
jgi:hypothetical protein